MKYGGVGKDAPLYSILGRKTHGNPMPSSPPSRRILDCQFNDSQERHGMISELLAQYEMASLVDMRWGRGLGGLAA